VQLYRELVLTNLLLISDIASGSFYQLISIAYYKGAIAVWKGDFWLGIGARSLMLCRAIAIPVDRLPPQITSDKDTQINLKQSNQCFICGIESSRCLPTSQPRSPQNPRQVLNRLAEFGIRNSETRSLLGKGFRDLGVFI
jgi:hypothetical protein